VLPHCDTAAIGLHLAETATAIAKQFFRFKQTV
jgi:hypothetical protein